MGNVLQIAASRRVRRHGERPAADCQIVIFPGVRIERHAAGDEMLDLGYRLLDPVATGDLDGFTGKGRPLRSS